MAGDDLATGGLQLGDERVRSDATPRRGPSASRRRGRRSRGRARTRHSAGDRGGASRGRRSRRTCARAGSSWNRLAGQPARPSGAPAGRTGRARADGAGRCDDRPQDLRPELRRIADQRPEQPPPGAPVGAAETLRRWPPPNARGRAARPPSSGWATGASGWTSSTPRAARSSEAKNGEASVSGRIVEQTSWRNPGSVSSAVRVPPPAVGAAS